MLQVPHQLGAGLGQIARGLLARLEQLGLALEQLGLPGELDEDGHLRAHELRDDRLHQVVHRADRVPAHGLLLGLVRRGEEDDRRVARAVALPDELGRLEPVHVRHLHVQQHHREVVREEPFERLAPGARGDEVLPQALEHRLQGDQVGRLVVDQEDVDAVGRSGGRAVRRSVDGRLSLGRIAACCVRHVRPPDRPTAGRPPSDRLTARPPDRLTVRHRYSHTLSCDRS